MKKIMETIAHETNGKSYDTYKYSYDSARVPAIEYDDETDKIMKWKQSGENIKYNSPIMLKSLADKIRNNEPIIRYFLDGSRHVYKVDDISYQKQVFPVIAAQIGIGCCERELKKMKSKRFYQKFVIVLPDKSNSDGWNDDSFFEIRKNKINELSILKKLNIKFDKILKYRTSQSDTKYEDRAIAIVQDYMIESEKQMVAELVKEGCLNQNSYLLKDGSLEYKVMKTGREDLRSLQKIKNNYRWVIGVSKSFNPESCLDHTGKPNSDYIANLPLFARTPVARYENRNFTGDVQFAVWYVRIRDKRKTATPFDGVLKIEKILMDDEIENGIDSDEVDLITANIINERTPTCYGKDKRWANHLYPVFLTESYVKSKYLSEEIFLNLF